MVPVIAWMLLWVVSRTTQRHSNSLMSSPRAVQSVAEHQPALLFHEWSSPFMQPWVVAWGKHPLSLWVIVCLSTHRALSLLTLFCVALSAQCQYNPFIWLTHLPLDTYKWYVDILCDMSMCSHMSVPHIRVFVCLRSSPVRSCVFI